MRDPKASRNKKSCDVLHQDIQATGEIRCIKPKNNFKRDKSHLLRLQNSEHLTICLTWKTTLDAQLYNYHSKNILIIGIFSPLGSRSLFLVCVSAERGVDVGMSAVLAPCVAVTVETLTSLTSSELSLTIGVSLGGKMICRSTWSSSSSVCLAVCVPGNKDTAFKDSQTTT